MNTKAYNNIRKEYENQWLDEESLTKCIGIQSIIKRFRAGKLTEKQVSFWANRE